VGLEDNHYYARGVKADNLMLVERQVRIMAEMGLEPMSAAETREYMGIKAL
jgi:uncharacterized protein (DUF849 family)